LLGSLGIFVCLFIDFFGLIDVVSTGSCVQLPQNELGGSVVYVRWSKRGEALPQDRGEVGARPTVSQSAGHHGGKDDEA
jgi:hypothetical protein